MDKERAMELLNLVVEYMLVGESISNTTEQLINIDFTEEELINEFNFDEEDVRSVLEDIN